MMIHRLWSRMEEEEDQDDDEAAKTLKNVFSFFQQQQQQCTLYSVQQPSSADTSSMSPLPSNLPLTPSRMRLTFMAKIKIAFILVSPFSHSGLLVFSILSFACKRFL